MNRFKAFLALCCAVAIFMTATLAYEEIVKARNEFHNRRPNDDITIHDDFDPDVGQKDVFVENTGDVTLYVRVKLQEYLDLTTDTANPLDHQWITHKYAATAEDCGQGMSGALFHNYFTWHMGGQKWYMPGKTSPNHVVDDKTTDYTNVPGAKQTPNAAIVSSTLFLNLTADQQKNFIGWIFCPDGYAYWSQPLEGGEATGLLLHGVTISDAIKKETYYYAINVIVEVVDEMDLPMWTSGAAPTEPGNQHPEADNDGKEIIAIIIGKGGSSDPGTGDETVLVVKNPVNPELGYTSHLDDDYAKDEGGQFSGDGSIYRPEYPDFNGWTFDGAGAFRLEEILVGVDYTGLTVEALEEKYVGGFSIGTSRTGKPAILYTVLPELEVGAVQFAADMYTYYPITTMLRLTQGTRSVEIKVTMEYRQTLVTWT